MPACTKHSLKARWLLGCTEASWQHWQDEAVLMHGPSTTPVYPLLLELGAETVRL